MGAGRGPEGGERAQLIFSSHIFGFCSQETSLGGERVETNNNKVASYGSAKVGEGAPEALG